MYIYDWYLNTERYDCNSFDECVEVKTTSVVLFLIDIFSNEKNRFRDESPDFIAKFIGSSMNK